jgi:5-methylcytosine-specific restriction endonuclease McrA
MKRGGPIARHTRLEPGAAPKRRTRLRGAGRRAARAREALAHFRAAVLERADGKCERCGRSARLHAHHVRSRAQGGSHEASNGAALCSGPRGCHALVHALAVDDWSRWIVQRKPRGAS